MIHNARNLMLDALAAEVSHISLHSGYPGTTGASEISGGSPAYARAAVTWSAAASSVLSASNQPSLNIPAASTILWMGFWNSLTLTAASNFFGGVPLGSGAPVIATAAMAGDAFTSPAHPFVSGDTVVLLDTLGSLPAGITEGTKYWVRDLTTDTFKVSATDGGTAIDLTTSGVAKVYRIVSETYSGQGLHTFTSLDVTVA